MQGSGAKPVEKNSRVCAVQRADDDCDVFHTHYLLDFVSVLYHSSRVLSKGFLESFLYIRAYHFGPGKSQARVYTLAINHFLILVESLLILTFALPVWLSLSM